MIMEQNEINLAAEKWVNDRNLIDDYKDAFKAGVEFAQNKLYSEEDMEKAFDGGRGGYMRGSMIHKEYYFFNFNFINWFESIKK